LPAELSTLNAVLGFQRCAGWCFGLMMVVVVSTIVAMVSTMIAMIRMSTIY
jgi:hypothetical protein